ncbi:MAG: ATP synthase F1 subunit epsilon [Bacteroidia bacterium]|nr:ATP synthase F1 subunit epsilon [Bacteroidia bacterium]NNM15451.1 ATP synthase F1 subunit epsilon [Bacteroidia bacterium]
MKLEIITPDDRVYQGEVTSVIVPGSNGQFQILVNHAPIISSLSEGKVEVKTSDGEDKTFDVRGGVIEVLNNKIILLAESV